MNTGWLIPPKSVDLVASVEHIRSSIQRKKLLEIASGAIEVYDVPSCLIKIVLGFGGMQIDESEIEDFKKRIQSAFVPLFSDTVRIKVVLKTNAVMKFSE
jgi:hypothetical protein